jgi:hypothetical protein
MNQIRAGELPTTPVCFPDWPDLCMALTPWVRAGVAASRRGGVCKRMSAERCYERTTPVQTHEHDGVPTP